MIKIELVNSQFYKSMNKLLPFIIYFIVATAGIGAWKAQELYADGVLTKQENTQALLHGLSWGAGIAFILQLRDLK
jgi:hypothetical protein